MASPVLEIGKKLHEIRKSRKLSLEETAVLTGVSKPMLGQIERGQSIPTITTLWKIATGLKVPLSSFLEQQQAQYCVVDFREREYISEEDGKMRAYTLFPYDPIRNVEFFYIEFDPGCLHESDRHADGVEEYVFVLKGELRLILNGEEVSVKEKQSIRFRADLPHAYQNPFDEKCTMYNSIFYPRH